MSNPAYGEVCIAIREVKMAMDEFQKETKGRGLTKLEMAELSGMLALLDSLEKERKTYELTI